MPFIGRNRCRRAAGPILLLVAAAPLLSGCVAAALIPIAAAGAIGRSQLKGSALSDRTNRRVASTATKDGSVSADLDASADSPMLDATAEAMEGFGAGQIEVVDARALPTPTARDMGFAVPPALPDDALDADQFISGFLQAQGERQRAGMGGESVVLMPETDPFAPQVTICEDLPYALLVELGGAPAASGVDAAPERLIGWVRDARQSGITVVFALDEARADPDAAERALVDAGLGYADHGTTLWIVGDKGSGDSDALRWKIASNYCIVAMVADRPEQFTFLYGSYPDDTMRKSTIASLWNAGWFLSPEPLALPPSSTRTARMADKTSNADNGVIP